MSQWCSKFTFFILLHSALISIGNAKASRLQCFYQNTQLVPGIIMPDVSDAIDVDTFNTKVAKNFYTALLKGQPVAKDRLVNEFQKFSDVQADNTIKYFVKSNYENGSCAMSLSSTPSLSYSLERRLTNRMVFSGEDDTIVYLVSSDPVSYYWMISCRRNRRDRRCSEGDFTAGLYVLRSMDTGIEVPIDLEQAGRDLKETTCLTPGQSTREQQLKFSYPYLYGDSVEPCVDPTFGCDRFMYTIC